MTRIPCKGCGRPIVFGMLPSGKRVPLDPVPPIYAIAEDGSCDRAQGVMVSHFATCKAANEFSASKSREVDDE